MRQELIFCVSQTQNETAFQFKTTGTRVFSFEEALYHVYHFWKQSADDFLSAEFIEWVNDTLGLSYLAARMKALTREEAFHKRMIGFLKLADYFNAYELDSLTEELVRWEKRRDWEKLKERADYLMDRGEPEKAAVLYRRALQYEENIALYNNLGVAYMRMEAYDDAFTQLRKAIEMQYVEEEKTRAELSSGMVHTVKKLSPSILVSLLLTGAEAALYGERYAEAARLLAEVEKRRPGHRDVPFLYGLMYYLQNDYANSIEYFQKAIALRPEPHYLYRLADVYVKMRQYDKSLAVLEQAPAKDVDFYAKQAELYAAAGNMPAAVKSVQKALMIQHNSVELWTKQAMYYRMDYDLLKANASISKALAIDPENERAKLENARIKKGMGRTKEYQAVLNNVLRGFRQKYRELGL